jgi:chromosome segregation ATPase
MDIGDFDWDRFKAEGKALEQRMRAVAAEMTRQNAESRRSRLSGGHSLVREQSPPDNAWEGRFDRFERMLTETLSAVTVLQHDVSALQHDVSALNKEVAALKQEVAALKQDVVAIREQMATKVELEALRDSVNLVADGFAQTQTRLDYTSDLLKRYLVS